MDSVIAAHTSAKHLLIFHVKELFFPFFYGLYFLNVKIYGKRNLIFLNKKKQGLEVKYYCTGIKSSELSWNKGKLEDFCIQYYESGMRKSETRFKNDKAYGPEIGYYESGVKKVELNWKKDKREGIETFYYESGVKESEKQWKDGILINLIYY